MMGFPISMVEVGEAVKTVITIRKETAEDRVVGEDAVTELTNQKEPLKNRNQIPQKA
jgi:hypothetical protein